MPTFNELLRANGIHSNDVALLRHSGKGGRLGLTPYDLWKRNDGSFDLYQQTQASGRPLFLTSMYWANFVAEPEGSTLFLGLYRAEIGNRADINWNCPITGMPPGLDKGRDADLYHLELMDTLGDHRGNLRIEWGRGQIAWVQRAHRNDKEIAGELEDPIFSAFIESDEGGEIWKIQKVVERDRKLSIKAFALNAEANGGTYACAACGFRNADRGLFDAHHPNPC